jgi:glycerol-3-phosphate dehydrogenase (NAD(P)+)
VAEVMKVAVVGGGSFGTVMANIAAGNGYPVSFWMRSDSLAAAINRDHVNESYLPGYVLNERVVATHDMAAAVSGAQLIFVAVPSSSFRAVVSELVKSADPGAMFVSTTKGIEAGSFLLMSQILGELAPESPIGVLSGPNLAKEIAAQQLTGTVIASTDLEVRDAVQTVLKSRYFRVYTNDDMFGVELGGSLKNIYAIVAGMAAALGMGHNTNSMLVTRGLTEMARFGRSLGADPMTFLGLSGVGDLVVTCSSPLSRNYRLGYALGLGQTIDAATKEIGQVVEGVNTVRLVKKRAEELGIYMPLASGLYSALFEGASLDAIISSLMAGEQALDVEFAAQVDKQIGSCV